MPFGGACSGKMPARCIAVAGCSNTTKEGVKSTFSSRKTLISANSCCMCSRVGVCCDNPGDARTKWECFALAVMLFCHWPVSMAV